MFALQACSNAPEPTGGAENGVDAPEVPVESPDEVNPPNVGGQPPAAPIPPRPAAPSAAGMNPQQYMTNEQHQQMAYYQNLQQQQQAQAGGQYQNVPVGGQFPQQEPSS